MRIVFAGAGEFGIPSLKALVTMAVDIGAVISWPDKPKGRGCRLTPTPITRAALDLNLSVLKIDETFDFVSELKRLEADMLLVVDFGEILTEEIIRTPGIGTYNLHASLLPRWRGAAPCSGALLAGDKKTGVTLFRIVRELDAGPIAGQRETMIKPGETAGELEERLSRESALLLQDIIPLIEKGSIKLVQQDPAGVTFAPKLKKSDGIVPWQENASLISRHIKAMQPWPRSFSFLKQKEKGTLRINILECEPVENNTTPMVFPGGSSETYPGEITVISKNRLEVTCGKGKIAIKKVQPAGKRVMTCADFLRGHPVSDGDFFTDKE